MPCRCVQASRRSVLEKQDALPIITMHILNAMQQLTDERQCTRRCSYTHTQFTHADENEICERADLSLQRQEWCGVHYLPFRCQVYHLFAQRVHVVCRACAPACVLSVIVIWLVRTLLLICRCMENEKIVIDSQHRMLTFCQIRDTTGKRRSEILKEVFPDQEVRAVLPTIDCNNLGFKHAHCCT